MVRIRSRCFALLAVLVLPLGCSVAQREGATDGPTSAADLERLSKTAAEQANDPGAPLFTVPSSLPGITTWSAFIGDGLTLVGVSEAGEPQAIVAWLLKGKELGAISCSTRTTSVESCASIADALKKDVSSAASDLSTASLHLLDISTSTASCESVLVESLTAALGAISKREEGPSGRVDTVRCVTVEDPNIPGSCWLTIPVGNGSRYGMPIATKDFDLAGKCCEARPEIAYEDPGTLVKRSVALLCGPETDGVATSAVENLIAD